MNDDDDDDVTNVLLFNEIKSNKFVIRIRQFESSHKPKRPNFSYNEIK